MSSREALDRCDREIAEIDAQGKAGDKPAYLVVLGRNDWEHEKRLIGEEE